MNNDTGAFTDPPAPLLRQITQLAGEIFRPAVAVLCLPNGTFHSGRPEFESEAGHNLVLPAVMRGGARATARIKGGDVAVVLDMQDHADFGDGPLVIGDVAYRFQAAAAIAAPNGKRLGTLSILDTAPRTAFAPREETLLRDLTRMIADSVDAHQRLYESFTRELVGRRRLADHLRAVVIASPLAVVTVDSDGIVTGWNPAAERVFGWTTDEVIGNPVPFIDDWTRTKEPDLKAALVDGKSFSGVEFQHHCKNGTLIDVTLAAAPLIDGRGRYIGALSIYEDISERKAGERALAATQALLEAADQAKSRFLATMSHELRTPLNAVIGFAEMMQAQLHGPLGDPRYVGYCEDIRVSGRHLLGIINDVLAISKADAGALELYEERVAAAELLTEAVRILRPKALEGRIRIDEDFGPDLPDLLVDRRKLLQVLLNLLSNAVKFTPAGGTVTVTAKGPPARRSRDPLVVTVSDTGIGMTPRDAERAMEPFVQLDNAINRRFEGTGLGLAVAKQLVELHNGSLEIETQLGTGTTVTLRLPTSRCLTPEPVG